jgi:hypothetical protein
MYLVHVCVQGIQFISDVLHWLKMKIGVGCNHGSPYQILVFGHSLGIASTFLVLLPVFQKGRDIKAS